jgi:hypothetical protein
MSIPESTLVWRTERGQLFICTPNETLSVADVRLQSTSFARVRSGR